MAKKALVTGSAGLIGSQATQFLIEQGFIVVGVDNDMRKYFFGEEASTDWNRRLLEQQYSDYIHYNADIRDERAMEEIFTQHKFDFIVHTAAQPSHDWAAKEPLTDFSVNATGTLILLECFRKYCPEAVFIFTSTNKVYGDTPNRLPLIELETRWEIDPSHKYANGIDETMSLDDSKHSIFGASKVAADVMVQEYGRYFNLYTAVFRGGCLTGPSHSGTELHGFLAYLVKCIAEGKQYTIFGYKGKQVRDNIHSADLISAFWEFYKKPRVAEVYNMGGSRHSNCSMMEAIEKIENILERKGNIEYSDQNRSGDHIWYISDVAKFQEHYPTWKYEYDIDDLLEEICAKGHFSAPVVSGVVVSKVDADSAEEVFVSSHVTESHGPVQALKAYLIKKLPRFTFVEHPFSYSDVSGSRLGSFRASLTAKEETRKKLRIESLSYIRDFLLTLYWFIKTGRKSSIFIGIGNLNALAGIVLKKLGFKMDVIYYAVGYSAGRFKNSTLNSIYQFVDGICMKYADFVWNVSGRMLDARKEFVSASKNLLVPNGVDLNKIDCSSVGEHNINTLVVVDYMTEGKGLDMILDAFRDLHKQNPLAKLVFIGTGPLESSLKRRIKDGKLLSHIEFKGALSPDVYLDYLCTCGIGICLRDVNEDSPLYYDDPTSPKEFLACGLPVVVSNTMEISSAVENEVLGVSTKCDYASIVRSVQRLWADREFYNRCSENAGRYSKEFSWQDGFDTGFETLLRVKGQV